MALMKHLGGRQAMGLVVLITLGLLAIIAHRWLTHAEPLPVAPPRVTQNLVAPDGRLDQVYAVAVSHDGKTFACVTSQGVIVIWDAVRWQVRKAWLNRFGGLNVLALSPDGKMVVTEDVSGAGSLQFWNAADGKLLWTIPATDQSQTMAFSPDSQRLAIEGGDDSLAIWEVAKPPRRIWNHPGLTIGMQSWHDVHFSQDGRLLAYTGGPPGSTVAALLNARTGKRLRTFNDQYGAFGHLALSSDNRLLATEGENPRWKEPTGAFLTEASFAHTLTVKIWDTRTGRVLRTFPGGWSTSGGVQALYFIRETRQLICCRGGGIDIWDVVSGKHLRHYDNSLSESMADGPLAIFPDERRLIGADGKRESLCVWDLRTGKVIRRIMKWR